MFRSAYSCLGVFFLLALASLSGWGLGKFIPAERPWTRTDLRLLDAHSVTDPAIDITAIYIRPSGLGCEIRLDFLDLPETPHYDFEIINKERVSKFNKAQSPSDSVLEYDPVREVIIVFLKACTPSADQFLTIRTASENFTIRFAGEPPENTVRLQFAFYNLFSPAATPAQALRRWDGAHTGPRGERHGLKGLLEAASQNNVPLTLLDLKTPSALSAIAALGGLDQLRDMEKSGLLEMPLVIYGEPEEVSLALSRSATQEFGLTPSRVYAATAPQPAWPFNWSDSALSRDGLPLEIRQDLLSHAIDGDVPLLVGGDFQRSTWGTFEYSDPAFAYLAARPYVEFVDRLNLPVSVAGKPPENLIERSALEMKFVLQNSPLEANYSALAEVLSNAAGWQAEFGSTAVARCAEICQLAAGGYYAILDPRGGRLVYLFKGQTQLIGPTAQFFVGMSDRSQWDLSKGEGADPAQIMGAFADADDAFRAYQAQVLEQNAIRFESEAGREKVYRLTENGLEVTLSNPVETKIPLVVDPQKRFVPGWAGQYRLERSVDGVRFGVAGGPMVSIQVTGGAVLAVNSFLEALPLLASPENPNAELPAGFYLPFPMTVVSISAPNATTVRIK